MRIEFEGRIVDADSVYAKRLIAAGRAVQVDSPDNLVKKEEVKQAEGGQIKSPGRPKKHK